MGYNLFLDDLRTVNMVYPHERESDFIVVRDYHAFKEIISQKGLPSFISFDNDLGLDSNQELAPDGYACAKWLFHVHSANPVAKVQIESLLNNYIRHLKGL